VPVVLRQILGSHLLVVLGFALGGVLVVHVLMQKRPTGSRLAWLLAIILIPYVGVPLYLVFGGRKLKRHAQKKRPLYADRSRVVVDGYVARVLCALGAPPPSQQNRVVLLPDGEIAFKTVIDALEQATESIAISTLIFANDEVGQAIGAVLQRKARGGVAVRVLIDAIFSFRTGHHQIAALRAAGVRVAWFMPLWQVLPFRGSANLRLHRKIILIDGQLAVVGGMNLAREYMGPTPLPGRWRDLASCITGPAVTDIATVFAADWLFASGETMPLSAAATIRDPSLTAQAEVQVVGSGPDVEGDLIYDALLSGVFEARERLWIATPYYVPDEALERAVALAVRRQVDVRILVPARSNHITADLAGAGYLRELAQAGAKVLCYQPGMMHGKIVLVDNCLGVFGSANFDMRSLFLNYEIALLYSSAPEIAALDAWFRSLLPACTDLPKVGRPRLALEAVAQLIAPLE
jgi:cardiolipin synthase A/B